MKTIAVIPSGGKGSRLDESLPKQYHLINGKELLAYTLKVFQNSSKIDEIYIAAQPEFFNLISEICKKNTFSKVIRIVEGGKERQDSVYNALIALKAEPDDLICVHDAARPLLNNEILENALFTAINYDNVLVCVKAKDTLLKAEKFITEYIDRDNVYCAQTPQVFRYKILMDSMKRAKEENFYGTDESMLVTRAGYNVKLVEGSLLNFKITSKQDMELFSRLVKTVI